MIFVTYAWLPKSTDERVLNLVSCLRMNGYDAQCDIYMMQQETSTNFIEMMAKSLTEAEKVIIVLSEGYKIKADSFEGGVGEEYRFIIGDMYKNRRKYIFISYSREFDKIIPQYINRNEVLVLDGSRDSFNKLLHKINNTGEYVFSELSMQKTMPTSINLAEYKEEFAEEFFPYRAGSAVNLLEEYWKHADVDGIVSDNKSTIVIQRIDDIGFRAEIDIGKHFRDVGQSEFAMALIQYVPPENWIDFCRHNYCIEFDICASKAVKAVQLELKNTVKNKIVNKMITVTENETHIKYNMAEAARRQAWGDVSEVCFVVFINQDYIAEQMGEFRITNLVLCPGTII